LIDRKKREEKKTKKIKEIKEKKERKKRKKERKKGSHRMFPSVIRHSLFFPRNTVHVLEWNLSYFSLIERKKEKRKKKRERKKEKEKKGEKEERKKERKKRKKESSGLFFPRNTVHVQEWNF
jgi:hypothetical protein